MIVKHEVGLTCFASKLKLFFSCYRLCRVWAWVCADSAQLDVC